MPRRLHSAIDLQAELGEPLVLRRLGLEVAQRVVDVVDQLHAAHAQLVRVLQRRDVVLDDRRAFHRQHDVWLAGERVVDVVRGQHEF